MFSLFISNGDRMLTKVSLSDRASRNLTGNQPSRGRNMNGSSASPGYSAWNCWHCRQREEVKVTTLLEEEEGVQDPLFLGNMEPELPHTGFKRHLGNNQHRIQWSVWASKNILDPSRVHTDEAPSTKDQLAPGATHLSTND